MILKINPRDVVSIPVDYNNTKGRACKYEVVDVLSEEQFNQTVAGISAFNKSVIDQYDEEDADRDIEDEIDLQDVVDGFQVANTYHEGYKAGRNRSPVENLNGWRPELVTAYNEGYADGKGHKAKKYK